MEHLDLRGDYNEFSDFTSHGTNGSKFAVFKDVNFIFTALVDLFQFTASILSVISCIVMIICLKRFSRLKQNSRNRYVLHSYICYLSFFLLYIPHFALDYIEAKLQDGFFDFVYCLIFSADMTLCTLIIMFYLLLIVDYYASTYIALMNDVFKNHMTITLFVTYGFGLAILAFGNLVCSLMIAKGNVWLMCMQLTLCCSILFVLCMHIIKATYNQNPHGSSPFEVMAASSFALCWLPALVAQFLYLTDVHSYIAYSFVLLIKLYPFVSLILFAKNDKDYFMCLHKLYRKSVKSYDDIDAPEENVVANGGPPVPTVVVLEPLERQVREV